MVEALNMTQEEKQLLLIDLCARLPYGVEIICGESKISLTLTPHMLEEISKDNNKLEWKPYLRPMSSMTEEEVEKYNELCGCNAPFPGIIEESVAEFLDWLNSHHFDYRGLIEKGLALEAPEGMYNF